MTVLVRGGGDHPPFTLWGEFGGAFGEELDHVAEGAEEVTTVACGGGATHPNRRREARARLYAWAACLCSGRERERVQLRVEQERQRAYALEQQFRQLQASLQQQATPQQPIDIFQDPEAALQQRFQPLEQRLNTTVQTLTLRASKAEAVAEYGKAAVAEMEEFIKQQGAAGSPKLQVLAAQMHQSDHPVGVAMEWYQGERLLRDTGGDLKSYRTKLEEELLSNPEFQAKAIERARGQAQPQPGSRPNIQLPPSLNKVSSAGVAGADEYDASDAGLFKYATRR